MEKQFIRVSELCGILGLEKKTVYRSIKRGEIPVKKVGGLMLVPISYVEQLEKIV